MRTESCGISELVSKYPFTRSGRSIIEEVGIRVSELMSREFEPIVNDALRMLEALIKNGEHAKLNFSVRDVAVSRYIAYVLTASMDKRIWRRIADSESKIFSNMVKLSYLNKPNLECIKEVARELELRIIGVGEVSSLVAKRLNLQGQVLMPKPFMYAVSIWDYLRNSPRNDPNWVLGTRPIIHGYILLTQHDVYRIIEEAVENKAITMISKLGSNLDLFKELIDSVNDRLKAIEESAPQVRYRVSRRVLPKGDPPCVTAIINELKAGGNPSHMARFTLATYMLHRCVAEGKEREECVDEVLEPFTHAADYNEKITRYQVEHLAGLRGGRKFYTPPSCQELNSLGLCPTNLGCGVKNPIQFIRGSTKVEGAE
ncbi:DNA primase large subunit [Caldivirga maquilingensis]|uniref:DNA primase large subunit PriL n=1 Tax=Caldivirga maquilingensis (strain ATCC 700844 / DSM 13496 / JCM 10307 / IC-167) TaxID=397948 RepID=A8MD08_CALMQ|nr:DNA primase large subunit [Caldivirga maquilingensis]ABW01664.1 DNA primase, large subunit [Caldivirga maquilingensis IC-167]